MKNTLSYYYEIHPNEIKRQDNNYYFNYKDDHYILQQVNRPMQDINSLYDINKKMLEKDLLVHEIIINKEGNTITYINNKPYILMRMQANPYSSICLYDIYSVNIKTQGIECDRMLNRDDWVNLWEIKNDYVEYQLFELGKKYPYLSDYVNYYIGLAENAISYVRNALKVNEEAKLCICHKRIYNDDTLFSLYNPLNYVYDYRVRDICEYVKSAFFENDKRKAYQLVHNYFSYVKLTYKEAMLFYGRLLYPSYFYDVYDDIVNNQKEETAINKIIFKADDFELFLKDVYIYISRYYNNYIPSIDWIIKKA